MLLQASECCLSSINNRNVVIGQLLRLASWFAVIGKKIMLVTEWRTTATGKLTEYIKVVKGFFPGLKVTDESNDAFQSN